MLLKNILLKDNFMELNEIKSKSIKLKHSNIDLKELIDLMKFKPKKGFFSIYDNQTQVFYKYLKKSKLDLNIETRIHCLLNALLLIGDNDECANKHIAYSLDAIKNGKSYKDAEDYNFVGTPDLNCDFENEKENDFDDKYRDFIEPIIEKRLKLIWKDLETLISLVGIERTIKISLNVGWGYKV
jgi:hypothetical protein